MMIPPLPHGLRTLLFFGLIVAVASACSESATEPDIDEAFIGSWITTSVIVDGEELVSPESPFYVNVGLWDDASYSLIVRGDESGLFCDGSASCNEDGDYSYSGSTITFDPGTEDALSVQYSVDGDVLSLSGSIDGTTFSALLERT